MKYFKNKKTGRTNRAGPGLKRSMTVQPLKMAAFFVFSRGFFINTLFVAGKKRWTYTREAPGEMSNE